MVSERNRIEYVEVEERGRVYKICLKCSMDKIDGSARDKLSGAGGAYCSMCYTDRDEASSIDGVETGFDIVRTVEEHVEIYEALKEVRVDHHFQ